MVEKVNLKAEARRSPPILLRKRPNPPQTLSNFAKTKTLRDLPNTSTCHCCRLRFDPLLTLPSQWRVVFLCTPCLRQIHLANLCSYCFNTDRNDVSFVSCRQCSCRVHRDCVPTQRGYASRSDFEPGLFVCVDCCALPTFWSNRCGDELDDVVRDANCEVERKNGSAGRAKEKAAEKADAARRAAEVARVALDFAVRAAEGDKNAEAVEVADEQLALRLHLEINGSQRRRISRNRTSAVGSDRLFDVKKNGSSSSASSCRVEVCLENKLAEDVSVGGCEPEVSAAELKNCSDSWNAGETDAKNSVHKTDSVLDELPVKEGQASCSDNNMLSSAGYDDCHSSVSASCQRNGSYDDLGSLRCNVDTGDDSTMQEMEIHDVQDRYKRKYFCKRRFRLRESATDNKESVGSTPAIVTNLQMSCSNASRTCSDIPNDSQSLAMLLPSNVNGVPDRGS